MRLIGRFILYSTLASVLFFWVVPALTELWQKAISPTGSHGQGGTASYFPLSDEQWLTFDIPRKSILFRFYAHAALLPGVGDNTVGYTIDYQWLDQQGKLLEERQHHLMTRAGGRRPGVENSEGEQAPPLRSYDHDRSQPSRDHALYFHATEHPDATTLRLRVSAKDSYIEQVGVRPYQQFNRAPEKIDIAWQRMSHEERENLSDGALYPSFLLSDYERRNLLSTYWKPIGPLGVLGKDYTIGTIYEFESELEQLPPETPAINGLFADRQHWVTLVLEDPLARYRIAWQAVPDFGQPEKLQLLWQGLDLEPPRTWEVAVSDRNWEGDLAAGLLQLVPDQPGIMRLFKWREGEWRDITPEKQYTRAFFCAPDAAIRYTLAVGPEPQPLKIDARAFSRRGEVAIPHKPAVHIQLVDSSDITTVEQTLELSVEAYPYQHFPDIATIDSHIFETLTRYMVAGPASRQLRISCDAPSLVSVYSRPEGLPITRELPAQQNYWYAYEDRQPAWFTLLPDDAESMIRKKQYSSLVWYFKPLGLDSILANEEYSWESVAAENPDALESQAFSPHASDTRSRPDARRAAYIPVTGPATLLFAGRSNQKSLEPSAIYLKDDAQPQPVQVFLDGKLVVETTIAGRSGRIGLPNLLAGQHNIEFRSGNTRWFVNNTAHAAQTMQLRTGYSGSGNSTHLSFRLETSGKPQQIGLWLFDPNDTAALHCQASLNARRAGTLMETYTFLEYQYLLASTEYDFSYILQRREPTVRGPIRLSLPLDIDLPAQTLDLVVRCDKPGILVSVGLVSDGVSTYQYFEEEHEAY